MEKRQSGWSLRWVALALALAGAACSSEQLGGNHGSGGEGCPLDLAGSASCLPGGGLGGTVGAGGHKGAGGSGGSGGTSMDAGTALCDQIAAKYQTALSVASACTPGAANQCQALVGNAPFNCPLAACSETLYVNDDSLVESERDNWLSAGCGGGGVVPCFEAPCNPPQAVCVPTSPGATTGTCVPLGSDGGAGFTPDGGESCDQLAADYAAAVSASLACTPGAPNQCQAIVSPTLSACATGCDTSETANDATAVNAIRQWWTAQCAPDVGCPLSICLPAPPTGLCALVDGGGTTTAGVCVTGTPAGK